MEHVKKREEISKEFTWALEDLYQDQAAWSEDLEKTENWHRSCVPAKERLWKVQKI